MTKACYVHQVLEKDKSPREVQYWSCCGKWMCKECGGDPVRRTKAWSLTVAPWLRKAA